MLLHGNALVSSCFVVFPGKQIHSLIYEPNYRPRVPICFIMNALIVPTYFRPELGLLGASKLAYRCMNDRQATFFLYLSTQNSQKKLALLLNQAKMCRLFTLIFMYLSKFWKEGFTVVLPLNFNEATRVGPHGIS